MIHILLQLVCAFHIRTALDVVLAAVIEDQLRIMYEVLRRRIQIFFVLLFHGGEVHRFFDHFVIIGYFVPVDGLHERPGRGMVLHIVEQVEELIVVGSVARLAGELVHIRGPARSLYRRDVHGIDLADAGLPFFGRSVDDVALAECADLGENGFFLLEKHTASFEIADLGDHGALHDCAALIVFDVPHPTRFLECDLFGETLLLEVADGVIVGVGKEMLDRRGGFNVVFKMGHEMRAVAFDLLVRGDGAKHYFGELSAVERAVCDATNWVSAVRSKSPLWIPTQRLPRVS